MLNIKRIFYETRGKSNDSHSIERALLLLRELTAYLDIYVIYDELPDEIEDFKIKYKTSVRENEETQVELALSGLSLKASDFHDRIGYRVEEVFDPYERIIDVTADKHYDIIIKMADKHEDTRGFSAIDVHLIRQSLVPIWFTYNAVSISQFKNIMVAIDPETIGHEVGTTLTSALANYGDFIAKHTSTNLQFVSCWPADEENTATDNNVLDARPDLQPEEKAGLLKILQLNKIMLPYKVVHIYGDPIPTLTTYIHDQNIDLLILGTSNVLNDPNKEIGHTAAAIIEQIYCDMLIVKPIK